MAYSQAQLDALRVAVARGVRTVEYDGQRVQYQSVAEMLQLISLIERELSQVAVKRYVYGAGSGAR